MKKVNITMSKVNKNPFERKQEGAVVKLCIVLMIAGSLSSCAVKADNVEGDENSPIYVWTKGQKYYYAFDEKIFLYEVPNKVVLSFDREYLSDIQTNLQRNAQIRQMEFQFENGHCIFSTAENTDVKALIADLKKQSGVKSVNPMYACSEGGARGITDEIVLQFKENVSQQEIESIYKKYFLKVTEITHRYQIFSVPVDLDPLEVANAIQTSGLTNFSYPSFLLKMEKYQTLPTDPY